MPYSETDIGSSSLCWGKKEQTVSKFTSLTVGIMAPHNSEILAFVGNFVLCVRADDNGNMSSILTG